MEPAFILKITLAFVGAIGITWFQYFYNSKKEGQLTYWLSFLRFTAIFCVFLLLINPSIQKKTTELEKPSLHIAIDNSKSIAFNNSDNLIQNFLSQFKSEEELNEKFDVNYYAFGKDITALDSLSFVESHTNLAKPIVEISKLQKGDINNPLIIVSDGIQTIGRSIEFQSYNGKVYPVIVGDTTFVEDILIEKVLNNIHTYIKNKFPVEVFVQYNGNNEVQKKLSVIKGSKVVFSKKISFSKSKTSEIVSFFLQAEEKGIQHYNVRIENLKNEEIIQNNSKHFSIDVIEEQSKILLVSSISHPDIGMLKKAIESNKSRTVSIVKPTNKEINVADYQLVILYQPNRNFKPVYNQVLSKNLNHFIITGKSTDWNFLNSSQSLFSKKAINSVENYTPIFNNSFDKYVTSGISVSSYAPLTDFFGEINIKTNHSDLLVQKIGNVTTNQPMLSVFEIDNSKTALLFGENSWRWRMQSFNESEGFGDFDNFISNLIQYLVSNTKNNRLNIDVNSSYYSNENIYFTALYLDENLKFDDSGKLWLTVSNKSTGFYSRIPFAIQDNKFVATISNLGPGEYAYNVSIDNQKEKRTGKFVVLPYEVEEVSKQSNYNSLNKLANKTNGKTSFNEINSVINLLLNDADYKNIQRISNKNTPLIDWKWLLLIIIISLSAEWFTRKYFGKI